MNAAEICRYRKDILSQTKRCLHSQLGEPPSFYHRIHLLISDSERGLFANLLRGSPAIPGKPSQLFYSLHTAALNPVISPKEHFFRHIQRDLRASASGDGTSPRPPGLTALPPVPPRPAPSPQSAPKPLFFGRLPLPLWCDLCTHWPGLGSCEEEAGPTVGPLSAAAAAALAVPQVEEESPTFRYHEPQPSTSIVHFQVRSETTQKLDHSSLLSISSLSREVFKETAPLPLAMQ